ncbi:MAG: hypothetical protein EHM91_15545 [Planctomycetota bacterium]|nr:MAG: hypothetical protein EHM91_15545 [Planctomycetota bacterium]
MQRTSIARLVPHERRELEEILRRQPNERFLSDYGDSSAWWLTALLGGVAGAVAATTQMGNPLLLLDYGVSSLRGLMFPAAFAGSAAVAVWASYTWITNHRRRGYAVTSFAVVRVKGRRLVMMSHAELARLEWRRISTRTQRFSVLTLTGTDGRTMTCYVHAGWVRTAVAQIDEARRSAQLPPLSGDARQLPE